MSDDIDALRAEVAALRAKVEHQEAEPDRAVTRRRLLTGLASLGAVGAASVATAPSARAADGDPLLIGDTNDATKETFLTATFDDSTSEVVLASQPWGVMATAASVGVLGGSGPEGFAGVAGVIEGPVGSALYGKAEDIGAIGLVVRSQSGPAIEARSTLDGVTLELQPAARTGPPTAMPDGLTEYRRGSITVDMAGDFWLCTTQGAPGKWTRLMREDTTHGRVIPITPFRALDTRATGGRVGPAITGQRKGPIHGGETVTLHLRDHPAIPATATGAFGSLCVVTPNYTGSCRVLPSGSSNPASAVNFWKGVGALSNSYTSALGTVGLSLKPSGSSVHTTHLILDVAGYLT